MDCRAHVAARKLSETESCLALRSFTSRNPSLTGAPLRLICGALSLTTMRQRSECEKPHEGDFLRFVFKFPRTGERR